MAMQVELMQRDKETLENIDAGIEELIQKLDTIIKLLKTQGKYDDKETDAESDDGDGEGED